MKFIRSIVIAFWNFLTNFLFSFIYYFKDLFTDKNNLKVLMYTTIVSMIILKMTESIYMVGLFWFGFYSGRLMEALK